MSFRKDFAWGAATAAFQIEGASREDGKGPSVWDMFCEKPGAVHRSYGGDPACEHYRLYHEDVRIMGEIGLKAYRFSLSWPRILPEGRGKPNPKGLDFYDRLVDSLLEAGIDPYVTLFHWDYPYELYCRGGWLNPESPEWFADYARLAVGRFSDRVKNWITVNEPNCFIGLGHLEGVHAPGDRLGMREVLRAGHNVLLAHGKAVMAIRAESSSPCRVGFAPLGSVCCPDTEDSRDVEAARTEMFSMKERNLWGNTWWMDPVYLGSYPEDGLTLFGKDAPEIGAGDMRTINQKLDFFCFNNYRGQSYRAGKRGEAEIIPPEKGNPQTAFFDRSDYWAVTPEVLYWAPKFFHERYRLPVVVSENGMSNIDWVSLDGKVHDPQRIDFLDRYLRQLARAADEGVDVRGYFLWSLMDNFEWAEAYKQRFGIVHVDFETQKRTMKDSAYWYRDLIKRNGNPVR